MQFWSSSGFDTGSGVSSVAQKVCASTNCLARIRRSSIEKPLRRISRWSLAVASLRRACAV
eukprot:1714915-Amphidinium_carterae.1